MEQVKKLAKRLFCVPWGLALVLSVLAAASLAWVFVLGNEDSPLAYGCYVLAFYALVTVCTSLTPRMVRWLRMRKEKHARKDEAQLRQSFWISLLRSLCIKLAYAAFNLISGLVYGSAWLISMGLYYLVLAVIRLVLAGFTRAVDRQTDSLQKDRLGWNGFQTCGVLLLLLHLTTTGVIFQIIRDGSPREYGEIMVIANAAYTFYRVISAAVSVVRRREKNDPIRGASRNLKLTEAWMSLFFLQAAMLSVFDGTAEFQNLMNSLTGGAVCILVVFGAVGMIVHGYRRKKSLER